MRDVSLGQYYPAHSVIHRLDARIKLVITVAYIVLMLLVPTLSTYLKRGGTLREYIAVISVCYVLISALLIVAIAASRIPFGKIFRSLRTIIFLVVFTALLTLLFGNKDSTVIAQWWVFTISAEGIVSCVAITLRLIYFILMPTLLSLTTTPTDLTAGLESLLKPLTYLKFPVHYLAIIMSIALRLIPTLVEETDKIMNAQRARCADFDSGNIFKKARSLVPVLVPLLVNSLRRADELADAMDSRCYRGAVGRTRMKQMKLAIRDLVTVVLFTVAMAGVLAMLYNWFGATDLLFRLVGIVV